MNVRVTGVEQGAYFIDEYHDRKPFSHTQFLLKQLMGQIVQVVEHDNNYFKTNIKQTNGILRTILICKKDCIVLQT